MLQAASIIPREVQINEAQKCTNILQQNFIRDEHYIENVDSQVEFRWNQEFEPQQRVALKSTSLMLQNVILML